MPILCAANGIKISNMNTTYNNANNTAILNFDLGWENSWRSNQSGNWDAAWVFFKYKDGTDWQHLDLTGNNITLPAGYTATVPSDHKGVFIYRSSAGTGNVNLTGCQVGVTPQFGSFDIKGFALEMVYIPQDSFYVGDGGGNYAYHFTTNTPAKITSSTISLLKGISSNGNNNVYDDYLPANASYSPASGFPTGYNAFYIMKYELSQSGFRDFLNCLTYYQQAALTASVTGAVGTAAFSNNYRSYIEIATPGISASKTPATYGCDANGNNTFDEGNDGEWVACGYLMWERTAAYLDWVGLRPFTELEFEKACRGPVVPKTYQYVWGNTSLLSDTLLFAYKNSDSESVTNTINGGMANFYNPNQNFSAASAGPVRNGIFATATSNRNASGATYYGVMEMGGNLTEHCVYTRGSEGYSFTAEHGDGSLSFSGYSNVNLWPEGNPNIVNSWNSMGITNRGGCFSYYPAAMDLSIRISDYSTDRTNPEILGCRGARTAE